MTLTNQIVFMKRLSLGTSAGIQYRISAFPWPCKSTRIKSTETQFCLWFIWVYR